MILTFAKSSYDYNYHKKKSESYYSKSNTPFEIEKNKIDSKIFKSLNSKSEEYNIFIECLKNYIDKNFLIIGLLVVISGFLSYFSAQTQVSGSKTLTFFENLKIFDFLLDSDPTKAQSQLKLYSFAILFLITMTINIITDRLIAYFVDLVKLKNINLVNEIILNYYTRDNSENIFNAGSGIYNSANELSRTIVMVSKNISICCVSFSINFFTGNIKLGIFLWSFMILFVLISAGFSFMIGKNGMKFGQDNIQYFNSKMKEEAHAPIFIRNNLKTSFINRTTKINSDFFLRSRNFTSSFQMIAFYISLLIVIGLFISNYIDANYGFSLMHSAMQLYSIPFLLSGLFENYFKGKGALTAFNNAIYPKPYGTKILETNIEEIRLNKFNFTRKGIEIFKDRDLIILDKHDKINSIGFFGKSGSGKSTILKTLAKEIVPTYNNYVENGLMVNGISVDELEAKNYLYKVLYLPQSSLMYDNISIRNIFKIYNPNISDKEIWTFLEIVNLKKEIKSLNYNSPQKLSGGQQQRLFIALNLSSKPNAEIVLLDEATSALDEDNALSITKNIINHFKDLEIKSKRKIIVIFVSHFEKLKNLVDKVIILDEKTEDK